MATSTAGAFRRIVRERGERTDESQLSLARWLESDQYYARVRARRGRTCVAHALRVVAGGVRHHGWDSERSDSDSAGPRALTRAAAIMHQTIATHRRQCRPSTTTCSSV